jgi:phosphoribosylaminoimidazolecarboxamide formyltransferase/IMP cyclohydrolase
MMLKPPRFTRKEKPNILVQNEIALPQKQVRTCKRILVQERNNITDNKED